MPQPSSDTLFAVSCATSAHPPWVLSLPPFSPSFSLLEGQFRSAPSMPCEWHCRQGPRNPIQATANYANAHPWQQMDRASLRVTYSPPVDLWIKQPCCGDPVYVHMTTEQKSTASDAGVGPQEGGPWQCACPAYGPSGWTSTGCLAQTSTPLMALLGCWTDSWPS